MMHALDPAVHEPIFKAIVDLIPPPPPHRWAVTVDGSRTGCVSGGS